MNVASLELCKELYELSGWDSDFIRTSIRGDVWNVHVRPTDPNWRFAGGVAPAYSLGYLLRKLPNYIPTFGDDGDDYLFSLKPNFEGNEWEAAYWGIQKSLYWNRADTPEDAACKLAIELYKQGVLK